MTPIKLFASLLILATSNIIHVNGCSCPPGVWEANTPEEKAAYIRDESGESLYVIATFMNETTFEIEDDTNINQDDEFFEPATVQNTTWLVREIVWNTRSSWPKRGIDIRNRNTIIYEASTETTCCMCGRSFSSNDIGKDMLIPIGGWQFSTCGIMCNMDDEECNDLAAELKSGDESSSLAME